MPEEVAKAAALATLAMPADSMMVATADSPDRVQQQQEWALKPILALGKCFAGIFDELLHTASAGHCCYIPAGIEAHGIGLCMRHVFRSISGDLGALRQRVVLVEVNCHLYMHSSSWSGCK